PRRIRRRVDTEPLAELVLRARGVRCNEITAPFEPMVPLHAANDRSTLPSIVKTRVGAYTDRAGRPTAVKTGQYVRVKGRHERTGLRVACQLEEVAWRIPVKRLV